MTTLRTPRQAPGRELRPLTVQLDADTHQQLRTLAQYEGRPISAVARRALEAYVSVHTNGTRPAPDRDADV